MNYLINILIIYPILANAQITLAKEVTCYVPVFFNTAWTDNRPDFIVNMTFGDQGSVHSETTVCRPIAFPISKFRIVQKEENKRAATLYNVTARLCDIHAMFNKVPLMKQAYLSATKQSNMTFECPLKPGFYVMSNMRIGSRNPMMTFMFRPKVPCYALSYSDTSWTDRRPYFTVNMTFSDKGLIQSQAWVQKDIAYPVSKLRVSQKTGNFLIPPFNITARLCEIHAVMSRIPSIHKAFLSSTKDSNLTLECPLKAGFYVIDNIRIEKNSRILAFMYRPKMSYLFEGGLYEELKNKKLQALTTYRFTAQVVKASCKD